MNSKFGEKDSEVAVAFNNRNILLYLKESFHKLNTSGGGKKMKKSILLCAIFLIAFSLYSCKEDSNLITDFNTGDAPGGNAQSIMVDIDASNFVIVGEEVWQFDAECGATYFSSGTSQQKKGAANSQKCTFWSGGTLTQTGNAIPNPPGTVDPKTCWTLVSSNSSTTADVTVGITIAGESYMMNGKKDKYSFSLLNGGTSRIENLTVTLSGDAAQTDMPSHNIITGSSSNCSLGSMMYDGNAGQWGNIGKLLNNKTMSEILASGSQNPGCSALAIGVVDPVTYTLEEGSYTITVSGRIKGNDGSATQNFSGTAQFSVTGGCN
jgi:hypothetical protein